MIREWLAQNKVVVESGESVTFAGDGDDFNSSATSPLASSHGMRVSYSSLASLLSLPPIFL